MPPPPKQLFTRSPAIIGMIHVAALPGTPAARQSVGQIIERAVREAALYARHDIDGLLIENMHDRPYLKGDVGPEIVAAMTAVGSAVRQAVRVPLGVQVLAGANHAALAIAHACEASFIRVENFVFGHVADEGLMATAAAGPLLRYRRSIGAEHVYLAADIRKKHAAHALTADITIAEEARAAVFFGADAVIVTGLRTGVAADQGELRTVRQATTAPLWVGSGVTLGNLQVYAQLADVLIVGSHFKVGGRWENRVDPRRVSTFMRAAARVRAPGRGRSRRDGAA